MGVFSICNEEIPCKNLNQTASSSSDIIAMQFFQTKHKWFLLGIYKPPKQDNSGFLETMNILLNDYTETSENLITLGDFNKTVYNSQINGFIQLHDMSHIINEPICFQLHDPTCINNILTNGKTMFNTSKTFESGLSGHHKSVSTIMKSVIKTLILNVLILP